MAKPFSHRSFARNDARERFAAELFDSLWERYRKRVSYVQAYEKLVAQSGATFHNDHIAFRTIALQKPTLGISTISRVFEALGYSAAACYVFADKHLSSMHYQHSNPAFPKLFISELKTWELPERAQDIIRRSLSSHRQLPSQEFLSHLQNIEKVPPPKLNPLKKELRNIFGALPWKLPQKLDIEDLNLHSQFGAWVLIHGYDVNHFTASVNSHGPGPLENIEKTVSALRAAGVPMKAEIEGAPGSKLRQSATEAVINEASVVEKLKRVKMPWTYAYFEIAERGQWTDPESGRRGRFEGFLGPQATQLFEMTKIKGGR